MILHIYIYSCKNCGNTFKSPELPGNPYGDFLMRSATGEMIYLLAFEDTVFQEIKDFLEKNKMLSDINERDRMKIFHKIFSVSCDPASDNSEYQIGRDPFCPKCKSNDNLSWHPSNPPEIVDIEVNSVTHKHWDTLSRDEKEDTLNKAIRPFLKS